MQVYQHDANATCFSLLPAFEYLVRSSDHDAFQSATVSSLLSRPSSCASSHSRWCRVCKHTAPMSCLQTHRPDVVFANTPPRCRVCKHSAPMSCLQTHRPDVVFANTPPRVCKQPVPTVSSRVKYASVTVGASDALYGVQNDADTISRPCAFHWNILVPPTAWGPHLDITGGPMYRADPLWPPLQSLRNVALWATHVSL